MFNAALPYDTAESYQKHCLHTESRPCTRWPGVDGSITFPFILSVISKTGLM